MLFDRELALDSSLDAVDNVTVSAVGDVLVCEDGGNLEIGLITSDREVSPLIRFVAPDHAGSEVCGVVFDPSGTRLYFTSQRAFPAIAPVAPGAVYEVTGPFRLPKGGVPKDLVYGPPAGEARPGGPLNPGADGKDPKGKVKAPKRIARKAFARRRDRRHGQGRTRHQPLRSVSTPTRSPSAPGSAARRRDRSSWCSASSRHGSSAAARR